jgi:hypothetical protein
MNGVQMEKTFQIQLQELREQIAQEIEDTECQIGKGGQCVCKGLDLAAAIVRGTDANL